MVEHEWTMEVEISTGPLPGSCFMRALLSYEIFAVRFKRMAWHGMEMIRQDTLGRNLLGVAREMVMVGGAKPVVEY